MLFSLTTFVSLFAASASLVSGASVRRQDGDNGSCDRLQALCYDQVYVNFQGIWGVEACLFAGVCYERNHPTLDDFLVSLWQRTNRSPPAPKSQDLPRMTQAGFNAISHGKPVITEQDWITDYNQTVSPVGPFPTSSVAVSSDYHRIATWTGFCTGGIPFQNFADYFQYSATHPADLCPT